MAGRANKIPRRKNLTTNKKILDRRSPHPFEKRIKKPKRTEDHDTRRKVRDKRTKCSVNTPPRKKEKRNPGRRSELLFAKTLPPPSLK